MGRSVVQGFQDHERGAFGRVRRSAERTDRQYPGRGRAPDQPRMGRDRACDAGAVRMRAFLAAQRIKAGRNGVRKFGMIDVDGRIDHGNDDIGAVRKPVGLSQPKFDNGILGGIALAQNRPLLLQQITKIRLHRTDAGIGGEFAADGVDRAAVGDTKQADGSAYKRKIL